MAARYNYSTWSDEELQARVKLYQNDRGHFDVTKVNISSVADYMFIGSLLVMLGIFIFGWSIFDQLKSLWSISHFGAVLAVEVYPLIFATILGLYVIGGRIDAYTDYLHCKRELVQRLTQVAYA